MYVGEIYMQDKVKLKNPKISMKQKNNKMRHHHSIKNINISIFSFLVMSFDPVQWLDFTRPLKN